jgi:hypothetical protein
VIHQVGHATGGVALVADLHLLRQIEIDRLVQADAARLDLPSQQVSLRDRPAEQAAVRIDGALRLEARKTVALLQQHLAVLHDRDGAPAVCS